MVYKIDNNEEKGGVKDSMESEIIPTTYFYEHCPYCGRKIRGTTENQILYNMELHIRKCMKKNPLKQNVKN